MLSYQFGIAPRGSDGTLNVSILNWAGSNQVGPALYSATLPWTAASPNILVSGINLPLTTGNLYGAVVDLLGYDGQSVHLVASNVYAGGMAFWSNDGGVNWHNNPDPTYDYQFRAEFGGQTPVPEPASLLLLGTGLGGIALAAWRRKKA